MVKRSSLRASEARRTMLRDAKHDGFRLMSSAHCSPHTSGARLCTVCTRELAGLPPSMQPESLAMARNLAATCSVLAYQSSVFITFR